MLRPFSLFFFLNQLGSRIHRALKAQNDSLDEQMEPSCILLWGCPVWQWLGNSSWSPGGPGGLASDSILMQIWAAGAWPCPSLTSGDTEASVAELRAL